MTSVPAAGHPAPPDHPELPAGAAPSGGAWPPTWPGWSAPAALLAGFAGALIVGLVISLVGLIFGAKSGNPPASVSLLSVIGQDVCLVGAALLFARMTGVPRPWQFGLRPASFWRSLGYVVAGYLIFILASYVWLQLIGQSNTKDTITQDLGADGSTIALIGVTFVVTVCAPLAEEFFFRGYFFGALRSMGLWPAAIMTGFAFGVVHVFGSPIAFIVPLALLGTGLCLLREYTGSLYPGIALHCVNNAMAMSSSQHWGWQIPVVLIGSLAAIALIIRVGLKVWNAVEAAPRPPAPPAESTAVAPTA
jgi:membrane protease YdiL (CAAX protease family)